MPNAGGLTDREAAIDAVIRFVWSLDQGDAELCGSSITEDMVMDLTPFQTLGWDSHAVSGKAEVIDTLMKAVGKGLDTTHTASNIRCAVDGDTASLTCCTLAQHFRRGEGPSPKYQDHYLMGNLYDVKLARDGDLWKISKLTITPAWTLGTPDVMNVVHQD